MKIVFPQFPLFHNFSLNLLKAKTKIFCFGGIMRNKIYNTALVLISFVFAIGNSKYCAGQGDPHSRRIIFEHIADEQGLSSHNVYCILQDKRGFMWFGTEDGLNMYDGYTFTTYNKDPYNKNSLSSGDINCMAEEANGKIWIGTAGGGLNVFDPKSGKFKSFMHTLQNTNFSYG